MSVFVQNKKKHQYNYDGKFTYYDTKNHRYNRIIDYK